MIIDSGIVTGSLQVSGSFSVQGAAALNAGLTVIGGITGSISGSSATAVSASYASFAANAGLLDGSDVNVFATTGSNTFSGTNNFNIISASYIQALSASIEYLSTIYQTSSIVYSSGSNQFGDAPSDVQTLYGTVNIKNGPVLVTGSLNASNTVTATSGSFGHLFANYAKTELLYVSGNTQLGNNPSDYQSFFGTIDIINGPVLVTGSLNVANRITAGELTVLYSITGSLNGTASYADAATTASLALLALNANTASYVQQAQNAYTASYVQTAQTASFVQTAQSAITASYVNLAQTASYVQFAENAFTASYVDLAQSASYVATAVSASRAISAANADTASFVLNAVSSSYSIYTVSASHAIQADLATTASYILSAVSASYAVNATNAATASSADNFTARGFMGVGGPTDAFHQLYVTTSISDGTLGLDSSGEINALYFLKGGVRGFEISTQVGANHITQLLPYTSSGQFRIGNPSNASNDLIFLAEPTGGRVILGPGILTSSLYLSGSQQTDLVQFTGDTFVSGALTVLGNQYSQGTITSTGFIGNLTGTADTAISAPYYVTTASYNADSASVSTRVTNLESFSSSLDSLFVNNAELNAATGSLQAGVTASINLATGSLQSGVTASINIATGSLQTGVTASINTLSSSVAPQIANLEATSSNLTTASSSFSTRVSTIEGNYATTGSNTFTGAQYVSNTSNVINFTSTASLYTDGGLRVTKDAYVSGGLWVAGDLNVFGTSSVNYVTTSVFVGLEYINLNTELPALRYAGINVGDSGSSAGISSSFWYDSEKDNWLYVHAHQGGNQTSSLAINGPITYNNLGNEQGLLANYITKAQLVDPTNNHHITSSQIFDDGTTVAIAGNLQVTGSLRAANLTGSLNGSNLVAGSVGNDRLTNSTISGIALGSNLATLTIGTGLSGTSYNGSTGVTIANSGVTSIVAGTGVTASSATGAVTVSIGQAVNVGSNVTFGNATTTNQFVTVSSGTAALNLSGSATQGGSTFFDFIRATNTAGGSTNINKSIRINSTGAMEWVNSAYSTVILTLTDAGALTAAADVTAFSDARLKENVNTITGALDKVARLRGVTYNRIDLEDKSEKLGFIAQEVLEVIPQVVLGSEEETYSVAYGNITALHNEAIKEQQTQIKELKAEILELKGIISTLINK